MNAGHGSNGNYFGDEQMFDDNNSPIMNHKYLEISPAVNAVLALS